MTSSRPCSRTRWFSKLAFPFFHKLLLEALPQGSWGSFLL